MKFKIPPLVTYIARRGISLFIAVIIALYVTILVANMGGYVDELMKNEIRLMVTQAIRADPYYRSLPKTEVDKLIEARFISEIKRRGLDKPFLIRSFIYLANAITLDLGRAMYLTSDSGSSQVKTIILERLPQTVMLFTTATVINFFIHLYFGLILSRKYGSIWDKIVIYLVPTSSIPGWFYGILLILIFASWLHILPYGGLVDYPPPSDPLMYSLSVLKHSILPIASWVIGSLFIGIYYDRTLFLIYSTEDYVEAARAKGLPSRLIERRYVLRNALPPKITQLAFAVIASWTGAIVTEAVFNWPGLGSVILQSIFTFDVPVLLGVTVIYAYLLAATVLILDIIYGFIDPRIRARGGVV